MLIHNVRKDREKSPTGRQKKETRKKGKREREKENWKRKKNKGNLVEEKNSERYRKLFAKLKFNE